MNVFLTGACGDIGRAIALDFAASGDRLILMDLTPESQAATLLKEIAKAGGEAVYIAGDTTRRADVDHALEAGLSKFGQLDVCVGNAGIVRVSPFIDLTPENWQAQIDVNLTGCFHAGQAAARTMKNAGTPGKIVFISSWVQDVPSAGISAYCVSKGGLKMLAKCMALELGRNKIAVNVVAPGFVDAGLSGKIFQENPGVREKCLRKVPLGYIESAAEVARAVKVLCSPALEYMTGATLLVDGGNSLFFLDEN